MVFPSTKQHGCCLEYNTHTSELRCRRAAPAESRFPLRSSTPPSSVTRSTPAGSARLLLLPALPSTASDAGREPAAALSAAACGVAPACRGPPLAVARTGADAPPCSRSGSSRTLRFATAAPFWAPPREPSSRSGQPPGGLSGEVDPDGFTLPPRRDLAVPCRALAPSLTLENQDARAAPAPCAPPAAWPGLDAGVPGSSGFCEPGPGVLEPGVWGSAALPRARRRLAEVCGFSASSRTSWSAGSVAKGPKHSASGVGSRCTSDSWRFELRAPGQA